MPRHRLWSLLITLSIGLGSLLSPNLVLADSMMGDGPGCRAIHPVQYGQTLAAIANYYGVGVYALMQVNHLDNPNRIYAGQGLCIPANMAEPMPQMPQMPPREGHRHRPMPDNRGYYVVQPGDTLAQIAWRFGVDVPYLMQINHLNNPNYLEPGQVICVAPGYQSPGGPGMPPPVQPPVQPPPVQPPPVQPPPIMNDWHGAYYNNKDLQGSSTFERTDGDINFDWGTNGPGNGLGNDNFSVRWTRNTYFGAGNYRFFVTADDGVRLYVDNVLVIDGWRVQPATNYFGDVRLGAGNHTLQVEYYEDTGNASIRLTWNRW